MKIRKKIAAAGLLAILAALPLAAQQPPAAPEAKPESRPSILILGTVHFGGSTADLFSPSVPDILSEKRQRELTGMIAALKRYQPTKIAIESTPEGIGKVNGEYQAYLKGEYKLKADEIDQIAYRLARELGQKQLYAADTKLDMDFEGIMAAAAKNAQQPLMDRAMELGKSAVTEIGQRRDASTLGGFFRWLNSPEQLLANHRPYLYMAQIGTAADPKGADVLAGWYRRNLLIYGNLVRLIDSPGERILLLIGQGHAKLLSEYIAESPNLRLVDPLQYLP
jgi:vacuolar-type H+-ATPase subunit H